MPAPTKKITIDNENSVTIRATRMNAALRQTVVGSAYKMIPGVTFGADQGQYNRALWRANIVAVQGDLFDGVTVPLTDQALDGLPAELDELMEQALREIVAINTLPNSPTPTTTPSTDVGS